MKHVLKIFSLLVVISALWIGLLHASVIPQSHTWLDIAEAKDFLKQRGVDVGSE